MQQNEIEKQKSMEAREEAERRLWHHIQSDADAIVRMAQELAAGGEDDGYFRERVFAMMKIAVRRGQSDVMIRLVRRGGTLCPCLGGGVCAPLEKKD